MALTEQAYAANSQIVTRIMELRHVRLRRDGILDAQWWTKELAKPGAGSYATSAQWETVILVMLVHKGLSSVYMDKDNNICVALVIRQCFAADDFLFRTRSANGKALWELLKERIFLENVAVPKGCSSK